MDPEEERLVGYARDRVGVPPPLLEEARRVADRSGDSMAMVLVQMGVLSADQVRSVQESASAQMALWDEPTRVDEGLAPESIAADEQLTGLGEAHSAAPTQIEPGRAPLPPRPADDPTTRVGDAPAESLVARRLHDAEVAEHHARWLPHLRGDEERYSPGAEIARGGMGRIVEAHDQVLGRTVAMKLLIGGAEEQLAMQARFTEEAQITGQLEHPNIVPVHDLGIDPEGQLYFTMKRVKGRTLRQVLRGLRKEDPVLAAAFPLHRLLDSFKQMCLALAYAHSRGVVHRDLKPSNVMFGDFGEVLVMDWGLAKILPRPGRARITSLRDQDGRWNTRHGEVIGTPGYMPPELAMGQLDDVDARSDVYSLGALLYEILTLRPPYSGGNSKEILKRQLREPLVAPRERAPDRDVPAALERICLRCLAREMERRYPSALALHADVDAFLAGALEEARQSATAARFMEVAADWAEDWRRRNSEQQKLQTEVLRLNARVSPAAGVEARRGIWAAEAALARCRLERSEALTRAEHAYRLALAEDASNAEARRNLADLYVDAMMAGERAGDEGAQLRMGDRLERLMPARHAALMTGHARLNLQTDPVGAQGTLMVVEQRDHVLVPGAPRELGVLPRIVEGLAPGRYLVVMRAPGRHAVQVPVRLRRGEQITLQVRLYPDGAVARGFVHVPAGRSAIGGDPEALRSLPRRRVELRDFCVARLPVTCRQYLDFVNALALEDPERAHRRCPRLFPDGRPLFQRQQGGFAIPTRAPDGGPWDPNWPVFGINAGDAEAYARWLGGRDGRALRLPTEQEWEAAARGVDERAFVWGDRWLPDRCKNAHARPGPSRLEPCGSYAQDRSPYGVMDLAGGVADWTASADGPRPDGTMDRVCRGGDFMHLALHARAASRHPMDPTAVAPWVGFRLVQDP